MTSSWFLIHTEVLKRCHGTTEMLTSCPVAINCKSLSTIGKVGCLHKSIKGARCVCPVSTEFGFSRLILLNISITKVNKNPTVGAQPIHAGRDGYAHIAKLIGVLRDYIRTRLTAGRALVKWLIVGLSLPRSPFILTLICILSEVDIAAGRSGI